MAEKMLSSHAEFVSLFKQKKLKVFVDPNKAGDFIDSNQSDPNKRAAHIFWSWSGLLMIPVGIVLLFFSLGWGIFLIFFGLVVTVSARNTAAQFVLQNILEDGLFFEYVVWHKGARIEDAEGNTIVGVQEPPQPKPLKEIADAFGEAMVKNINNESKKS